MSESSKNNMSHIAVPLAFLYLFFIMLPELVLHFATAYL